MENKEEEIFDVTDGEILEELKFFVYFLFELEEKSLLLFPSYKTLTQARLIKMIETRLDFLTEPKLSNSLMNDLKLIFETVEGIEFKAENVLTIEISTETY